MNEPMMNEVYIFYSTSEAGQRIFKKLQDLQYQGRIIDVDATHLITLKYDPIRNGTVSLSAADLEKRIKSQLSKEDLEQITDFAVVPRKYAVDEEFSEI